MPLICYTLKSYKHDCVWSKLGWTWVKLYLKSDRTSCHRFVANQFRLFLHSAAYVLLHALKTNILGHTQWANATIDTIRIRLLKIGARVRQLKTRIKVELPTGYPLKETLTRSFQVFELLRQIAWRNKRYIRQIWILLMGNGDVCLFNKQFANLSPLLR